MMLLRLILCVVIVAGGVWFLAWTIWNLRLPSWLAGRPERYVPRHRSGLADTDTRRMLPPPEDVSRPEVVAGDKRPENGPGHPYDPPERQAIQTAYVRGVYLPLTGVPALDDTVTDWPPRTCARREARAALWQPPEPGWAHRTAAALADEYWPKAVTCG